MNDAGRCRDAPFFRSQLLVIDSQLGSEEVAAMKFLCADILPMKKLQGVTSAEKLFQLLIEEDRIGEGNLFLVAELLYRIRQHSLLRKLNYTKEEVQTALATRGIVTAYRQLLFDISEDTGREDHESFIFLLRDMLPKNRRDIINGSTLDLLTHLEAQELLSPDNLEEFEKICKEISPDLGKKIRKYKEEQVPLPSQESSSSLGETSAQVEFAMGSCSNYPPASLRMPCETVDISGMTPISQAEEQTIANVDHSVSTMSLEQSLEACGIDGSAEVCDVYKMGEPCRGRCVIINNEQFRSNKERRGSKQDAVALQKVFTWLCLEVDLYENLTATEILKCMETFQTKINHKEMDCFVCCILSHGESGSIYGSDDVLVPIRKVMSYFAGRQCPSLVNKPKLFFIQACQGKCIQQGAIIEADANDFQSYPVDVKSIPDEADFLLGMATVDGFVSFRDVAVGSWYMRALCRNLANHVPRKEDILSILIRVNDDVSKEADSSGLKKQMPEPSYTLRKKVIFPVPKNPPPYLN